MTHHLDIAAMARERREEEEAAKLITPPKPKLDIEAMAKERTAAKMMSIITKADDLRRNPNQPLPDNLFEIDRSPRNINETLAGRRQRSDESLHEFLEATADARQGMTEILNQSTMEAQPTGFSRLLRGGLLKGFPGIGDQGVNPLRMVAPLVKASIEGTIGADNVGTAAWNILKAPVEFAYIFAKPLVVDPLALTSNLIEQTIVPDQYNDIPAEEKRMMFKQAAGMWIGVAAAIATRSALGGMAARAIISRTTPMAFATASEITALQAARLAQLANIRKVGVTKWMPGDGVNWYTLGAAEGVVGGIASGLVEGEEGNKLGLGLEYAMFGAPIGLVFEGGMRHVQKVRGKPQFATRDMQSSDMARDIMALKTVTAAESFSPEAVASMITNFGEDGNIVRAAARVAADLDRPIIFELVDGDAWRRDLQKATGGGEIGKDALPKDITPGYAVFDHGDGLFDILIMSDQQKANLIPGWHGSGTIFDEFNTRFINTGEGTQMEGWGLYFGEVNETGKFYHRVISRDDLTFPPDITPEVDPTITLMHLTRVHNRRLGHGKSFTSDMLFDDAIKELQSKLDKLAGSLDDPNHFAYSTNKMEYDITEGYIYDLQYFKKLGSVYKRGGALYESQLVLKPEETLHLTRPLDAQPEIVQRFVREYTEELPDSPLAKAIRDGERFDDDMLLGEDIYRLLVKDREMAANLPPETRGRHIVFAREVSEMLDAYGIKGNRYADAGPDPLEDLRSNPTSNYVVFNHNNAKLLRRHNGDGTVTDFTVDNFIDRRQDKVMFTVAGQIPGSRVGYKGRWYTYEGPLIGKDGVLEGHKIKSAVGRSLEVGANDLTRDPSFMMTKSEVVTGFKETVRKHIKREFDTPANILEAETINLQKAIGRELAEDLYGPTNVNGPEPVYTILGRAGETITEQMVSEGFKNGQEVIKVVKPTDPSLTPRHGPEASFAQLLEDYMAEKVVPESNRPAIAHMMAEIMNAELMEQVIKSMDPAEGSSMRRAIAEHEIGLMENRSDLVRDVAASGLYIDPDSPGGLVLRDTETGSIMGVFHTFEGAREFAKRIGAPDGPELVPGMDGSGPIPPGFFNILMDAGDASPFNAPWTPRDNNVGTSLRHWFNTTFLGRHLSPIRAYMTAIDDSFKTKIVAEVWHPISRDFMQRHAVQREAFARIEKLTHLARNMTPDELHMITRSLEQMSAEEVKNGLMHRTMTTRELDTSAWFIRNRIDSGKALGYRRKLKELHKEFGGESFRDTDGKWRRGQMRVSPEEMLEMEKQLQASMGIDIDHVQAVEVMERVIKIGKPDELSLLPILEYADAILRDAPSQAEFIRANNMSAKQLQLMDMIKEEYRVLGPEFDIPQYRMLNRYVARRRIMNEDVPTQGSGRPDDFVHDKVRIGEIDNYEMDPINALIRYANAGYGQKFTNATVDKAMKYLDEMAKTIPGGEDIKLRIINNYVNEVQGKRHIHSVVSNEAFKNQFSNEATGARYVRALFNKLGMRVDEDTVRGIVNTGLSLSSTAGVGFRPMQGLRDITTIIKNFEMRYGPERTAKMLTIMSRTSVDDLIRMGVIKAVKEGENIAQAMTREGAIPTVTPIAVEDAAQRQQAILHAKSTKFRSTINHLADEGIKWGGQYNAYQWGHAAVKLESLTHTTKVLNAWRDGKFGEGLAAKVKAYDIMTIDQYDRPIQLHFNELVSAGKLKEAAEFLAHGSSFEINYIFGMANSGEGGGTSTGRMLSQFGSWSFNERTFLSRLATQGTLKHRAQSIGRWARSRAVTQAVGWALGYDLSAWYVVSGAYGFRGGPAATAVESIIGAFGTERDREQAWRDASRLWMLGIPGAMAMRDWMEAVRLMEEGYNPFTVMSRGIGIKQAEGKTPPFKL